MITRARAHADQALERFGFLLRRRGDLVAQVAEEALRGLAPGRRRQRQRLQVRGSGGQLLRGEHTGGGGRRFLRTDLLGERHEQLGPVDRLQSGVRRRLGGAEVDDHRTLVGDEDVRRPQGTVGDATAVHRLRLAPDGLDHRWIELLELVEPVSVDILHRDDHRSVGQRGQGLEIGAAHAAPAGEQEEQALVLDVALERCDGPLVGGVAQDRRAIAAVQQVGIAGVAGVHLDERRPAVGQRRPVQLRPAADGALEAEPGHIEPDCGGGRRPRPAGSAGGSVHRR